MPDSLLETMVTGDDLGNFTIGLQIESYFDPVTITAPSGGGSSGGGSSGEGSPGRGPSDGG